MESSEISSPPHDPVFPAVGSPSPPSDDAQSSANGALLISDDLSDRIIKQVEYYFSDENLPTDKYLLNLLKKDKKGFVPIAVIASFRKMKKLTQDIQLIVAALRESSQLVVSSDGKKVKRLHPVLLTEVKDSKICTVLVENLAEDSTENIQRLFGAAGNIKKISIHDPYATEMSTKDSKVEKLLSGKLHALVEYETLEAAERAVATLNNEQDWRNGMRVKLLHKQMSKYGQRRKGWKGSDSEKNNNVGAAHSAEDEENHNWSVPHNSSEHNGETPIEEDGEHLTKQKNGQKGRNRPRSRGQKYRAMNGHGHGTLSSSYGAEGSKPPPGPRMPDGTRGFTMGRGRPLVPSQN